MKKLITILTISFTAFLLMTNISGQDSNDILTNPKEDGYVPNAQTAIKIAEAIWLPIYGNSIYDKKPFKAELKNDEVWVITGTVGNKAGGAPYAEIQKKDCKVIKVTHFK